MGAQPMKREIPIWEDRGTLGRVVKRWVVQAPVGTIRYWVTLVAVVSRLGAGQRMQVKMFLLGLVMPQRDKWIGPRERGFGFGTAILRFPGRSARGPTSTCSTRCSCSRST